VVDYQYVFGLLLVVAIAGLLFVSWFLGLHKITGLLLVFVFCWWFCS